MKDPHYLNPQIFPSNKDLKPRDHHRILYSSVAILLCASIVGGVYWWRIPKEEVVTETPNLRTQAITRIQQRQINSPSPEAAKKIVNTLSPPQQATSTTETRARLIEELRSRNTNQTTPNQ